MIMSGKWNEKRVWIDGVELLPDASMAIRDHSPDGFNWGYGGSGPAQLALAVMLELWPGDLEKVQRFYQDFKFAVIARLPRSDFSVDLIETAIYPKFKEREGLR